MRVVIQDDYNKMCKWAADYIAAKINNHKEDRPFILGLPTGSSPIGVYKELVRMNKAGELSFANVVTFNMDEYLGLPKDHDQSYWYFMHDNLLHIAFNEPFTSLNSRTGVRNLTTDTRIVNSRFFDNDMDKVPAQALSVGIGTVTDSKEVLILINGHNKARALAKTVEGGVSQRWTCSALQMHNNAIIACDEEACGELTVDTYKYFLDIEKNERL